MPHLETGDKYPFYVVPYIEKFKTLPPRSHEATVLRMRILSNIGDPIVVDRLLGMPVPTEKKEQKPVTSTMDTIDSFISKFSPKSQSQGYLQSEIKQKNENDVVVQLIKNQRYAEALKIIERLNLNNTEKNVYFADQIRFLKKLIAIEKYKQHTADVSAK